MDFENTFLFGVLHASADRMYLCSSSALAKGDNSLDIAVLPKFAQSSPFMLFRTIVQTNWSERTMKGLPKKLRSYSYHLLKLLLKLRENRSFQFRMKTERQLNDVSSMWLKLRAPSAKEKRNVKRFSWRSQVVRLSDCHLRARSSILGWDTRPSTHIERFCLD